MTAFLELLNDVESVARLLFIAASVLAYANLCNSFYAAGIGAFVVQLQFLREAGSGFTVLRRKLRRVVSRN